MNENKYKECVKEIEEWALSKIACPHKPDTVEKFYEELLGYEILFIIRKYINNENNMVR